MTAYYVSTTGNDLAPGDQANPLKTLVRAACLVKPGDTVTVGPGTYQAFIAGYDDAHPVLVGTKDAPITFKADGPVTVTRNNKTKNGFDLMGCSWVVLDGFTAPGMPEKGIAISGSTDITIRNCFVSGAGKWGVYASHSDRVTIENCDIRGTVREHGIYIANSAVSPIVRGNTIADNPSCGIHVNGDASQGGTGLITSALIEGNTITGNGVKGGAAINCDGVQDSLIQANVLLNNKSAGIALFRDCGADGSKRNRVTENVIVMAPKAKYCIGIKNGSTGNELTSNVLMLPSKGFEIEMTPDSVEGTTLREGSRVSTDDGMTEATAKLPGEVRA